MNADDFRSIALAMPGATESEHMSHPDFRRGGKVFASLGYPDSAHGMVRLTPEQQRSFVKKSPQTFKPCNGVWGIRGCTNVHLSSAEATDVRAALDAAFHNLGQRSKRSQTGPASPAKRPKVT